MTRQVRHIAIGMLVFVCFLNMAQAETDTSFVEQFFEANQAYKNDHADIADNHAHGRTAEKHVHHRSNNNADQPHGHKAAHGG